MFNVNDNIAAIVTTELCNLPFRIDGHLSTYMTIRSALNYLIDMCVYGRLYVLSLIIKMQHYRRYINFSSYCGHVPYYAASSS